MTGTTADRPTAPTEVLGTRPGLTEYGRIDISNDVVARIAARATCEMPDAGSAAPRMLRHTTAPGLRRTSLGSAPKVSASVDGSLARLTLVISIRWGSSVSGVATRVREHVYARVTELTGLAITDIDIQITRLAERDDPPRAH